MRDFPSDDIRHFSGTSAVPTSKHTRIYLVVGALGRSDAVIRRFEQAVCPPLEPITNIDRYAALDGIDGGPVLGCGNRIPDVSNLV